MSIWMKDYTDNNLPVLNNDLSTNILIIGGGLAGLICAYELSKKNIPFVLVEKYKCGLGVTSKTTAQVSTVHDDIVTKIEQYYDKETAIKYYNYQKKALKRLEKIISDEKISCDLETQPIVISSNTKKNIDDLSNLIKGGTISTNNNSLNDFYSYKLDNQLIINPMKYLMGILRVLINKKSLIYEHSTVTKIEKKKNYVVTINNRYKINTNKIIMACGYPIINPDNLYFAKTYQSTSYVVHFKSSLKLKENYVSLDEPYYYLRKYDTSSYLIGGADHYSGVKINSEKCYQKLIDKAYSLDKNAEILNRWRTEDCLTLDSLPFIGSYSNRHKNIYLITGFQKWGFTNSLVVADIVTRMIKGEFLDTIFNPNRCVLLKDLRSTIRMVSHSINGLITSKLCIKNIDFKNIKINSGVVTKYKGVNALVYRDTKNIYYVLKNKCTHMGCSLIWNDTEKVWESKCHGSIFDKYGKVIQGPAFKDLETIDVLQIK